MAEFATVLLSFLAACGATAAPLYGSPRIQSEATIVLDDGTCIRAALHDGMHSGSADNCSPTVFKLPAGPHELLVEYTPSGTRMEILPIFFVRFEARAGQRYRLAPSEWEQRDVYPVAVDPGMFSPVRRSLPRRFLVTSGGKNVQATSREASHDDKTRLRFSTPQHSAL